MSLPMEVGLPTEKKGDFPVPEKAKSAWGNQAVT